MLQSGTQHAGPDRPRGQVCDTDQRNPLPPGVLQFRDANVTPLFVAIYKMDNAYNVTFFHPSFIHPSYFDADWHLCHTE